jgi:hypothetical protein
MVRKLGRGLVLGGSLCVATFSFNACSAKTTEAPATDAGVITNPADGSTPGTDGSLPADDGATKSALGFTPSNIDLSGIDLTKVGDFVVDNDACTINSENNLASCGDGAGVLGFKLATQTDGSKVAVYVARTMNILAGKNLTVEGSNPVVFVALDTITITGTFNGNARDDVAIAGGQSQATSRAKGAGPGGGGASPTAAGGGGSYCGVGGAGASESGAPTTGGATYGSDAITPLVGGSSGGAGQGPGSGAGGGALQLVAGKSITIDASGLIHVGAGGGGFGGISTQDASGGGSGGSILLESLAVSVAGTLAANGAGGGAGTSVDVGGTPPLDPGGANATPNATAAAGGRSGIGPSSGGNGSAAASLNGTAGAFTAGNSGGGGGGGAGRIRINTKLGQATLTGTLSPSATTTCATQGTVKP